MEKDKNIEQKKETIEQKTVTIEQKTVGNSDQKTAGNSDQKVSSHVKSATKPAFHGRKAGSFTPNRSFSSRPGNFSRPGTAGSPDTFAKDSNSFLKFGFIKDGSQVKSENSATESKPLGEKPAINRSFRSASGINQSSFRPKDSNFRFRENNATDENANKYEYDVIAVNMVSHTRAGGRIGRFQALVICGDKNGTVGFGLASGKDTSIAIQKAEKTAANNVIKIPLSKDKTIIHDVESSYKGVKILIKKVNRNAKRKGIITGGILGKVFRLAGIENINCKTHGVTSSFHKLLAALWNAFKSIESIKEISSRLNIPYEKVLERFK